MNRARNALVLSLFCFLSASLAWAKLNPSALNDEAKRYQADIDVLASDAMEGRGLDTEGIHKAATWIEKRLETIGLEPAFRPDLPPAFRRQDGRHQKRGQPHRRAGRRRLDAPRLLELRRIQRTTRLRGLRNQRPCRRLRRSRRARPSRQSRPDAPLRTAGARRQLSVRGAQTEPLVVASIQGAPGTRAWRGRRRVRHRSRAG